jgi:hypothetical protein
MDDWVVVKVAGSEPEAELLCSVLRGAGIECLPRLTNSGAGAGDGLGTVGAHDIMVSPQDAQDAREILHAAGQLQPLLGVPEVVASDVRAAIGRRNRVAHDAWMLYSVASDSRASADTWAPWLEAEAAMLQQVVHGLARLRDCVEQVRGRRKKVENADLVGVWRKYVPDPIPPRPDREP